MSVKKPNYTINNYMPKGNPELSQFKQAMSRILAGKIYQDYSFIASRTDTTVEPESFVEHWVANNVINPDDTLKQAVWNCFMEILIQERKKKK
jgi:hypothetical protein